MTDSKVHPEDRPRHSDTDVLIVGAGPVGLTLALMLAARGIGVAVYERWSAPYPLPRAVAMAHDCVRAYQAAGLIEDIKPVLDLNFGEFYGDYYTADGELVMRQEHLTASESGWPMMNPFNQPDLEATLNARCADHGLIQLHRGWNAVRVDQREEFAEVTLDPVNGDKPRDGSPIVARARFVVGCDGANSSIRGLMNTAITDTGFSSTWLVLDTIPRLEELRLRHFAQIMDPARPATFGPTGHGRNRYEFMALDGETAADLTPPAKVWELLAPWGPNPENSELVRAAVYTFEGRWAETWRDGRMLLAGDAAHLMPPFMGQGFASGVRDCAALVWRLELILSGKAPMTLLDSYTTERSPHVAEIVRQSTMLAQMCCIRDPAAAEQRNAGLRAMMKDPSLAPRPEPWRLGPGLGMPGDPQAGLLSWQGVVELEGRSGFFDDVAPSGVFMLLGRGVDPLAALSDEARALWTELGGGAVDIGGRARDVGGGYGAWFDRLGAQVVLVRPDCYVFGASATAAGADAMVRELAAQLALREPAQVQAA